MPFIRSWTNSGESAKTWVAPSRTEKRLEVALRNEGVRHARMEEALALQPFTGALDGHRGMDGYGYGYGSRSAYGASSGLLFGDRSGWPRRSYAAKKMSVSLPVEGILSSSTRLPMSPHSHLPGYHITSYLQRIRTIQPVYDQTRPTYMDQRDALAKLEMSALHNGGTGVIEVRMIWSQIEGVIIVYGRAVVAMSQAARIQRYRENALDYAEDRALERRMHRMTLDDLELRRGSSVGDGYYRNRRPSW